MSQSDSRMLAAQLTAPRRFDLVEVPLPEPGPGQVRVRLEGCGVCASNIPPYEGRDWFSYPFEPGRLGHEGWGTVDAVGEGVSRIRVGQRVAALSNHAYAQADVIGEEFCVPLPDGLASQPFPGEPLACAVNIFHRSRIQAGETVAIVGIGFLGALLTQMASQVGARVIALARKPYALDVAAHMGAEHLVAMDDHWRALNEIRALTGGKGADVTIECTGKQWPLDLAGDAVREMGRMIVAGYHQDGLRQVNMQMWNWKGLDVINAHEREAEKYIEGIREAATRVCESRLDPFPLFTHQFELAEMNDALEATLSRPDGFMKALVKI